jgi:hypothetical protein
MLEFGFKYDINIGFPFGVNISYYWADAQIYTNLKKVIENAAGELSGLSISALRLSIAIMCCTCLLTLVMFAVHHLLVRCRSNRPL